MVAVALSSGRLSLAAPAWFVPFLGLRYMQTNPNPLKTRLLRLALVAWIALSATWYGATPLWGPAHFVFMALNAAFTVLPFAVYEWLRRHLGRSFRTTVLFAAATVAVEWLTISGSPFGSFGAGAYSQYGFLALLQFLSVGGMLGITFLIAWAGAVADWAVDAFKSGRSFARALVICAVTLAVVFVWGAVRLHRAPEPGVAGGSAVAAGSEAGGAPPSASRDSHILAAGLTAETVSMHELMPLLEQDLAEFRARTRAVHSEYLQMTKTTAKEGVDLIVWPELAGTGTFEDVAVLMEQAAELADAYDLHLAVSTMEIDPEGARRPVNQVSLVGPEGLLLARHVKFGGNFMEGTVAGEEEITTVDTALGRVGLAICWDFDFHRIVADTGEDSVDLMIVPAADWNGIDPLHGHMAVFRAIENGTTLVRQAQKGLSIIADPYGRVIDTGSGPANAIQATVVSRSVETFYPRITNILGLFATLFVTASAVVAFARRRRVAGNRSEQPA